MVWASRRGREFGVEGSRNKGFRRYTGDMSECGEIAMKKKRRYE